MLGGITWLATRTRGKLARRRDLPEGRSRWTYLYRAIDRDGNLIGAMLGEHRDMQAKQRSC